MKTSSLIGVVLASANVVADVEPIANPNGDEHPGPDGHSDSLRCSDLHRRLQ